jgi:hypothetical protein
VVALIITLEEFLTRQPPSAADSALAIFQLLNNSLDTGEASQLPDRQILALLPCVDHAFLISSCFEQFDFLMRHDWASQSNSEGGTLYDSVSVFEIAPTTS